MPSLLNALSPFLVFCATVPLMLDAKATHHASIFSSMTFSVQEEGGIQDYKTNPYDVSTYVNPNDTYVPSDEVEQSTDISSSDFEKSKDYIIEGAQTPIALFCVGFVALVVLNVCLCCGIVKICTGASKKHAVSCGHQCFAVIFFIFFVICFLATHLLYVGYGDTVDGLDIMRSSVDTLAGGFGDMNDLSAMLQDRSEAVVTKCTTYGSCLQGAEMVEDGVGYMVDDLGDVPDYADWINNYIDLMEQFVLLCMFLMYGFLIITLILYLLTQLCCKTKIGGAICCGNIAFFIVSLLGIIWMVATSITADFCYENPTINSINMMSASKGQMYLVWYSSCYSGENPVFRYVNHTHTGNSEIVDAIGSDTSPQAVSILEDTKAIHYLLGNFSQATHESCPEVQSGWLPLVNEGVCDSFFMGVRTIWICEVAACISLFFLMITGAIMGKDAKNMAQVDTAPDGDVELLKDENLIHSKDRSPRSVERRGSNENENSGMHIDSY